MERWERIIEILELAPLPLEGGLFRSTYRSPGRAEGRDMGSAIYFMLTAEAVSHLHRLPTDEVYHFYSGDPVELLELLPDGESRVTVLGSDICAGQQVQYVVRAGNWQGSRLAAGGEYALMGTTMSPGYEDCDYEHATDPEALKRRYPEQEARITALTGGTPVDIPPLG